MTLTAEPTTRDDHETTRPLHDDALPALPADLVDGVRLETGDGVVRLTGEVPSVAGWRRILELLLATPGVRVVADELQVHGAQPLHGAGWTERVAESVAAAPGVEGSVAVQITDGVVTLWGHVPSARMRERVIQAVRRVVGGAWVQTRITTD